MSDQMLQVGQLVCSIKGRDSGRYYLIVGIENDAVVKVADGEVRRAENPKRKNVKHLKAYDVVVGLINDKALSGKRVTNADVRRELKSHVEGMI